MTMTMHEIRTKKKQLISKNLCTTNCECVCVCVLHMIDAISGE